MLQSAVQLLNTFWDARSRNAPVPVAVSQFLSIRAVAVRLCDVLLPEFGRNDLETLEIAKQSENAEPGRPLIGWCCEYGLVFVPR